MMKDVTTVQQLLEVTKLSEILRDGGSLQVAARPRPREILKFTTKTTVSEALKVSLRSVQHIPSSLDDEMC